MRIAVICCSLNPGSRSAQLAEAMREPLSHDTTAVDWIDLRNFDLPICDGAEVYGREDVQDMSQRIADADAVVMAVVDSWDLGGENVYEKWS